MGNLAKMGMSIVDNVFVPNYETKLALIRHQLGLDKLGAEAAFEFFTEAAGRLSNVRNKVAAVLGKANGV
ncbi:hypothetical protein A3C37_02240 [Candidatus Peribacteria bacterium RIFCSPHIGHO2_02_FULL_53_20]|nr:MAG: hypothetical protein A3C37_02240 [Candidatus Peribacteria bacterium RIFCSPHIGHO2_02_FULL_53_20]